MIICKYRLVVFSFIFLFACSPVASYSYLKEVYDGDLFFSVLQAKDALRLSFNVEDSDHKVIALTIVFLDNGRDILKSSLYVQGEKNIYKEEFFTDFFW